MRARQVDRVPGPQDLEKDVARRNTRIQKLRCPEPEDGVSPSKPPAQPPRDQAVGIEARFGGRQRISRAAPPRPCAASSTKVSVSSSS
jgi:hypothetical protein